MTRDWTEWPPSSRRLYPTGDPIADLRERVASLEVTSHYASRCLSTVSRRLEETQGRVSRLEQWREQMERQKERRPIQLAWLPETLKYLLGFLFLWLAFSGYVSPQTIGQIGTALLR
mgnify:CR=1 FL=1